MPQRLKDAKEIEKTFRLLKKESIQIDWMLYSNVFIGECIKAVHDNSFQFSAVLSQMMKAHWRDSFASRHVNIDEVFKTFTDWKIAESFVRDSITKSDTKVL